jgi:hypothetical protein
VERDAVPSVLVVLTPRDVDLITGLWLWGLMLRDQVWALYFPGVALRRVNRRLKLLAEAGLITAAPLPLGPLSAPTWGRRGSTGPTRYWGRGQLGYRAAAGAAQIVARHLDRDPEEVRRRIRGSQTFAAHTLEVVATRVALEGASNLGSAVVLRVLPEVLLYHAYEVKRPGGANPGTAPGKPAKAWRPEVFRPDALAVVEHGGVEHHLFIEVDLSSVATAEFAAKMRVHGNYQASGLFTRRYGAEGFRTLVLTTSERRARNLRDLAEAAGNGAFRFTTLTAFQADPFGPIWHVPCSSEPTVRALFE